MTVKEKIYGEIDELAQNELALLYDQIKLIKRVRKLQKEPTESIGIDELHKYTASSKRSWAEDVIQDREDRV